MAHSLTHHHKFGGRFVCQAQLHHGRAVADSGAQKKIARKIAEVLPLAGAQNAKHMVLYPPSGR